MLLWIYERIFYNSQFIGKHPEGRCYRWYPHTTFPSYRDGRRWRRLEASNLKENMNLVDQIRLGLRAPQ